MKHEAAPEAGSTATIPQGLTDQAARRRLAEVGGNVLLERTPAPWRVFLAKLWGPIPWMLEFGMALQLVRGSHAEAAAIGGLLLFNATIGFFQEGRAAAAVTALKQRLAPTALVRRDGSWIKIPAADLVPEDVIRLPLGAIVPADATVVSGAVTVDQSMLTGESIPADANPGDRVYAGSLVRRGQAIAVVTATGSRTYFGHTVELVSTARPASTEQRAVLGATRNLAIVNGIVAALMLAAGFILALPATELTRLALVSLLATIPVALPATFTLSAAFSAQVLARRGVLLTRLSAAHEAAAMDVLCADKTGTLTQNALEVVSVTALPGFDRDRVLALAALASSEADQYPIDAAVRRARGSHAPGAAERLVRFVPFDPSTKFAEARVVDTDGREMHIVKGAFEAVSRIARLPTSARRTVDALARQGHRVIAVATGKPGALGLAGFIALSDPPRADSAQLIADLGAMGVRTVMLTGDSAATAEAIARQVGVVGGVCPPDRISDPTATAYGIFARVVPEEKYRLVKSFQRNGHVVGMCGDGVNDAPALRQAQIGIAVSTATDAAKAAAGMVMTQPGLSSVVDAVREGRVGFQRLLTYTFSMIAKKVEIVLFLAVGLALTGQAILTPELMVLMLLTNDFLAMSLTTDRASPAPAPSQWRMRDITAAAVILGVTKLGFSTAVLAVGKFRLGLGLRELQTLALVAVIFGSQALVYAVRERGRLWSSRPSKWVLASSAADIGIVSTLALSGTLLAPLSWRIVVAVLVAAAAFALVLDQIKATAITRLKIR